MCALYVNKAVKKNKETTWQVYIEQLLHAQHWASIFQALSP